VHDESPSQISGDEPDDAEKLMLSLVTPLHRRLADDQVRPLTVTPPGHAAVVTDDEPTAEDLEQLARSRAMSGSLGELPVMVDLLS
jgi:hypothetical protein